MRYREIARKLRDTGIARSWRNALAARIGNGSTPATGKGTVIPDWGNQDLKIGTLRSIVRQLGLDWEEFKNI